MKSEAALDILAGPWFIDPVRANSLAAMVGSGLAAHVAANADRERAGTEAQHVGRIAVIPIAGTMSPKGFGSSLIQTASTIEVGNLLRAAAADESIDAIVLAIDSPGGSVAGTPQLAERVAAAAARKPVVAHGENVMASAAYYAASQATEVYAHRSADVGSIGVVQTVYDRSREFENAGIKVHVIRTGPDKGVGAAGAPITDANLATLQEGVDEVFDQFVAAVATGRRLSADRVSQVTSGRTWIAEKALALGLIDRVGSLDDAISRAAELAAKRRKGVPMSSAAQTMNVAETTVVTNAAPVAPKVATLGELKAAMPGASSDFLLSQLEASATVDAARAAYSADLEKRVKELEAKAAAAPIREAAMSSHVGQNADGVPTDWRDPQVQAEFAGDVEAFKAFKRAEAAGAVRN